MADPVSTPAAPAAAPLYRTLRLREQGLSLPTGLPGADGTYRRDLAFRRWMFREEKQVGELLEKLGTGDEHFGNYVSAVLAVMVTRAAGIDLAALEPEARLLQIHQLPYGDVMYAYARLRYEALGAEVYFPPMGCPACHELVSDVAADLGDLEVRVPARPEALSRLVELRDGLLYLEKVHKKVTLRAPRWEVFYGAEAVRSGPWLTERILLTAVTGLEHVPLEETVTLTPQLLEDGLSKADLERLKRAADQLSAGPRMALELTCPHLACGRKFERTLEWDYADFFGRSSR